MSKCKKVLIDFLFVLKYSLSEERSESFMNVGEKLKNARVKQGLTQDELAEKLHITRQTISNWENSKSYPDILQIIELSNLYSLSLDELLKDDEEMIKHLEKSTNVVKSKKKLYDFIFVGLYLVIWFSILLWFWSGGANESALGAMGFSIVTQWIIFPISILVFSFLIGYQNGWRFRFLFSILFGISYPLSYYLTFSLANMISNLRYNFIGIYEVIMFLFALGISLFSIGIGFGIKYILYRKKKKKVQ